MMASWVGYKTPGLTDENELHHVEVDHLRTKVNYLKSRDQEDIIQANAGIQQSRQAVFVARRAAIVAETQLATVESQLLVRRFSTKPQKITMTMRLTI